MSPGSSGGKRWLIYALGGGVGHLTRAIALARVARSLGHGIRVLTNSPFAASLPIEQDPGDEEALIHIDPTLDRHSVASTVRSILEPCEFDVLIVNTFPRGLGGELAPILADLACPKVLIHRDLNPAYVRWAGLRSFATRYDLIILPGEEAPLGDLPQAIRTDPWLLRDRCELLDRPAARSRLGIGCDDDRPGIVVVGSGRRDEIEAARLLAIRMHDHVKGGALVRFVSVKGLAASERDAGSFIWPLLEVMAGSTSSSARVVTTRSTRPERPRLHWSPSRKTGSTTARTFAYCVRNEQVMRMISSVEWRNTSTRDRPRFERFRSIRMVFMQLLNRSND